MRSSNHRFLTGENLVFWIGCLLHGRWLLMRGGRTWKFKCNTNEISLQSTLLKTDSFGTSTNCSS